MATSAFVNNNAQVPKQQGNYVENLPPLEILKMFKKSSSNPAIRVDAEDSDPIAAFYKPPQKDKVSAFVKAETPDPIEVFYKSNLASPTNKNDPTAYAVIASPMVSLPKNNSEVTPIPNKNPVIGKFLSKLPTPGNNKPTLTPRGPAGLNPEDLSRLASFESGNKGYNALNKGSGAYGKYQFIPSTAAEYSAKLGLKGDEWKTPENQERMFAALVADNAKGLKNRGLDINLFNVYGAHQQGLSGFSDILAGNLSPSLERNMRSNLPSEYRNLKGNKLRNTWINYWKNKTEN